MKYLNKRFKRESIIYLVLGLFACNLIAQTSVTNVPPPAGYATRLDYMKSFTNEDNANAAYHLGLISKNEVLGVHFLLGNLEQQDFYGKAIDQYGQPVVGATVMGYLRSDEGFGINDEKIEKYKTQTDTAGMFQFTGLHGARFGQKVSKAGYEMDDAGYVEQGGIRTGPNDRVTFMMWKLSGPEPMVHVQIGGGVACDGTPARFDLLSGKKTPNGDLLVELSRNPVNIDRRKPFTWSITLEIPTGGVEEITNIYPNEAPADGYRSKVTYEFQTNASNWTLHFTPSFYFKSKNGQVYGRMTLNVMANFQPPPTFFGAEIYANPAGSRNLEFDYKKQIR